jgi:hypothetical protein
VNSIKDARKLSKADLKEMGIEKRATRRQLIEAFESCPREMMLEEWDCMLCGERGQPILTTKCGRCRRPAPSREGILKRQSAMKIQGMWRSYCARVEFKALLKAWKKEARRARKERQAERFALKARQLTKLRKTPKRMSFAGMSGLRRAHGDSWWKK